MKGAASSRVYVAATSALEAEPDSRPGEWFAKTGLSYGPQKSGHRSAGILEFDARLETGRSHVPFGQEGLCSICQLQLSMLSNMELLIPQS